MLRPTFLSFETAKRALSSSQRGLDTVGHNISNVNTPGYTRQRVDQVSISSSGYRSQYASKNAQFPGMGSDVIGINQIRDPHLDKRYRAEAAKVGEQGAVSDGLAEINAIFDEITKTGAHAKMSDFLKTLDTLIQKSSSREDAAVVRSAAQAFAQVLNKNYSELESVTTQQQAELEYTVTDINGILEQIAHLNVKIKEDNYFGNPSNELNDQRNLLIDQLSELVDINVIRTPVKTVDGTVVENLSINLKTDPPVELVNADSYNGFKAEMQADGTAKVYLVDGIAGYQVNLPGEDHNELTTLFQHGAMKGHIDILNGKGPNAAANDESFFKGIPHYKASLNVYANTFATMMNDLNAIKVYDPSTGSLDDLSLRRDLFVPSDGNYPITAANISVSKDWQDDPLHITVHSKNSALTVDAGGFIKKADGSYTTFTLSQVGRVGASGKLYDTSDPPVDLGVTLDELQKVMTEEYPNATPPINIGDDSESKYLPGSDESSNLTTMKLALTSTNTEFPGYYTGSFQEYLVDYQKEMAADKKLNDSMLDASLNVLTGIANSRDGISAVNMDEEGISMMTYQNYYNAAARYMTVLDEALGTIIQGMGVVGR